MKWAKEKKWESCSCFHVNEWYRLTGAERLIVWVVCMIDFSGRWFRKIRNVILTNPTSRLRQEMNKEWYFRKLSLSVRSKVAFRAKSFSDFWSDVKSTNKVISVYIWTSYSGMEKKGTDMTRGRITQNFIIYFKIPPTSPPFWRSGNWSREGKCLIWCHKAS